MFLARNTRSIGRYLTVVSCFWIVFVNFFVLEYYTNGRNRMITNNGPPFLAVDGTAGANDRIEGDRSTGPPPDAPERDDPNLRGYDATTMAFPFRHRRLWRPAAPTPAVDGPGEKGRPVTLDESRTAEMKTRFAENEFNVVASEMISLNRSLPDVRPRKCKTVRYPVLLPTTSVIVVFYNEAWSTLLRTIWSVINRSPRSLVTEILLVDDGSDLEFLGKKLEDYVATLPVEIKIIRKKQRTGLIAARLLGVNHVKSQVITFLDSHCECADGWLEPLLARIVANKNAVVSPSIDIISDTTFEHTKAIETKWGGFNWQLGYIWVQIPQREYKRRNNEESKPLRSPTIPGGIFSIYKNYFIELGTYDEDMHFWGGDNLELSFKVWMCGGTLEIIPCSRVSHVYRDKSPYPFPGGLGSTVSRNILRVAKVWMDDWMFVHYMHNDHAFDIDVGNVSKRMAIKKKLNCKSFRWYLKNIYPEFMSYDGDYFAGKVINVESNLCLDTMSRNSGKNVGVNNCYNEQGGTQSFGYTPHSLIVTDNLNCLGTSDNDDQSLVLFKCNPLKTNLRWSYDRTELTVQHSITKKCLEHSIATDSSNVILNECNGLKNQKWILNLLVV